MDKMRILSKSPEETQLFATQMLQQMRCSLYFLNGDLGSGKTTFMKGVAQCMGIEAEVVKSPTFTFLNEYEGFLHYDLYRMKSLDLYLIDQMEEQLSQGFKIFIEWPQLVREALSAHPHLEMQFAHQGGNLRSIEAVFVP